MKATITIYVGAALLEIAGCFAFWASYRLGKTAWWMAPGVVSLILFAWLLTRIESDFAGRAYAAYGGVYIAASLLWLWVISFPGDENTKLFYEINPPQASPRNYTINWTSNVLHARFGCIASFN